MAVGLGAAGVAVLAYGGVTHDVVPALIGLAKIVGGFLAAWDDGRPVCRYPKA